MAQGVRMDVEGTRGRADRAAPGEELLERRQQRGAVGLVVVGELGDRLSVLVALSRVARHAQEILVDAEIVVGEHAWACAEHAGAEQRVGGLVEPGPGAVY